MNILDLKLHDHRLSNIAIIGDVLHHSDRGADFASDRDDCYSWYYLIAQAVRPKIILEIGTRFGYSVVAMCSSPEAKQSVSMVHCVDDESCVSGSLTYASQQMNRQQIKHTMHRTGTQNLSSLDINSVDLCHVDADHSANGCFHDAMLCWQSLNDGGYMLIDDMKWYSVANGANEFLRTVSRQAQYIPSLRGLYVVKK